MTHYGPPDLVLIGSIVACSLVAVSLLHLGTAIAVSLKLRRGAPAPVADSKLPKAGVVISLRGADAGLQNCLRGLLNQDYPDYNVEIVVDSDRDPAWQISQAAIREAVIRENGGERAKARALVFRQPTCSLKCSALIQAVGELDESHQVIAFCDADVVPHRTWLRELVGPLLDPAVGATTGNRWYAGKRRLIGSQVRAAWNAAAISQMSLFQIPWGGTLAIRRETLAETDLLSKWSQSFNDDLVLGEAVKGLGLNLRLVPSLLQVECEESSLPRVRAFVFRQLMHVRFYMRSWPVVAGFGMFTTLLGPAAMILFLAATAEHNLEAALWCGGGLAAFVAILAIAYFVVERGVAATLRQYGRTFEPLGLRALWAAPLAVGMYGAALLPALFRRTVNWRGVVYRISAPWQVEMLEERPANDLAVPQPALTPR